MGNENEGMDCRFAAHQFKHLSLKSDMQLCSNECRGGTTSDVDSERVRERERRRQLRISSRFSFFGVCV
jgi:hypothetical protein